MNSTGPLNQTPEKMAPEAGETPERVASPIQPEVKANPPAPPAPVVAPEPEMVIVEKEATPPQELPAPPVPAEITETDVTVGNAVSSEEMSQLVQKINSLQG